MKYFAKNTFNLEFVFGKFHLMTECPFCLPRLLPGMSRGVVVYRLQSSYVEEGVPGWNGLGGETLGARWRQSGLVCDPTDNWQRADLHPPGIHEQGEEVVI